jgi:hypothetical protein
MYDVIPDIHGDIDRLEATLAGSRLAADSEGLAAA